MKSASPVRSRLPEQWRALEAGMTVVTLGAWVQVLVPFLALMSFSKGTRGLTLPPGRTGVALGSTILAATAAISFVLLPVGILWPLLTAWLLGSAGVAAVVASLRPTAFVKPICVRCRLLPVIKEHEAIHLTGVASEKAVWDSMKLRHSAASLSLEGDPAICSFCPIPKRLAEH